MASLGRVTKPSLLRSFNGFLPQKTAHFTFERQMHAGSKAKKYILRALGVVATTGVVALTSSVAAVEFYLHPPHFPWNFQKFFHARDRMSIRRGFYVYKQVCAACHSIEQITYRNLAGVIFTDEEAKAEAKDSMVWDGPGEDGEMYQRPGRWTDYPMSPYKNEQEAKKANNGVAPPDLSVINYVKDEQGGPNYIFHLLTSYADPPAGVELLDGQHYNPYFEGGVLSMAQALYNDIIQYDDGTPATQSQLAKDVVNFLDWTMDPLKEHREKLFINITMLCFFGALASWYVKRVKISSYKYKKVVYTKMPKIKKEAWRETGQ